MQIVGTVERVDASDGARIADCMARGVPVIVTGLVESWRLRRTWTRATLLERLGAARVAFRRSPTSVHPSIGPEGEMLQLENQAGTLAEYLALMSQSPNVFLDANLVCLASRRGAANPELAAMLDDVELPAFLRADDVDTIGLWLSGRGVRTRLHYDRNGRHNFNAQLAGRKDFVLVPPGEVDKLTPFPMDSPIYNFTRVDNFAPDLERYPRFAQVTGYAGTLAEGELIFIPAYWYHSFVHLGEFNFNLNFWCDAVDAKLSAVALRNELATILRAAAARSGHRDHESWAALAQEIERQCLAWSPQRATIDELGGTVRP